MPKKIKRSMGKSVIKVSNKVKLKPLGKCGVATLMQTARGLRSEDGIETILETEEHLMKMPSAMKLSEANFEKFSADSSGSKIGAESISSNSSLCLSSRLYPLDSSRSCYSLISDLPNANPVDRTIRELVTDIDKRVKNNMPRPPYLHHKDSMPANMVAWNGNELDSLDVNKSGVDIIGCHQPVELILVMADERSRRHEAAVKAKEQQCAEHIQRIGDVIDQRFSRAERYRENLIKQQLQIMWMKLLVWANYVNTCNEIYNLTREKMSKSIAGLHAAMLLKKKMVDWKIRAMYNRYRAFFKALTSNKWDMNMRVRILQKRLAVKRMTNFLNATKGQKQVSTVLKKFLKNVRFTQRLVRHFCVCKEARLHMMIVKWDRLEKSYIRSVMARRNDRSKTLINHDTMMELNLSAQLRIEMEKQVIRWDIINGRMDGMLSRHRAEGTIGSTGNSSGWCSNMEKLVVPLATKRRLLTGYLEKMRKEFVLSDIEASKRVHAIDCEYTPEDVKDMLSGKLIKDKTAGESHDKKRPFFNMFQRLVDRVIMDMIKRCHEEIGTFTVAPRARKAV